MACLWASRRAEFPSGIIATHDGGKTWRAVEGTPHSGWRGADFRSPEVGVVAGLDGTVARIDGNLLDVRGRRIRPARPLRRVAGRRRYGLGRG